MTRLPRIARAAAIVVAALLLSGFTIAVTAGEIFSDRLPAAGVRWWPMGARSQSALAAQLAQQPRATAQDIARADGLARAALLREPVSATAARTLGLIAARENQMPRANRLFSYAQSLSRADVVTQLWFIEQAVGRNDVPGALRHYDRALRTSRPIRETLEPILVAAAATPEIARPLGAMLTPRPPWWTGFAERLASTGTVPGTMAYLLERLALDPGEPRERAILQTAMNRMAGLGGAREAYGLYRTVAGAGAPELLRDGGFDRVGALLPPFGWLLIEDGELAGIAEESAVGARLTLQARNGRNGEVARQLLVLDPGAYRLQLEAGGVPPEAQSRPTLTLICARPRGQTLATLTLESAPANGRGQVLDFAVPGDCPGQILSITARSALAPDGPQPWIDNLRIARR